MGSRDFGFLSLRPPLVAYQANGLPVPPNNVLTTSNTGAASFTSTIIISTINANISNSNSISANTIYANLIDVNLLSTNAHYTSTISTNNVYTGYLQSNNAFITSSLIVTSTINVNTINTNNISTNNITTNYLSTFDNIALIDNNLSTLNLTWDFSTLYIDGHPVATDGTVSTVSTVFWNDVAGDGSIYNKNIGNGPFNYQVGIGTGPTNAINATLDVKYTGTVTGNVFNVSSYNNRFAITNISSSSGINFMNADMINNQNDTFGSALRFFKSQNFNSTVSGNELGYIDFYGTNNNLSTVRGAYILARQSGPISTLANTDLQFVTCTSSSENINMVITKDGNVGINTTNPINTLDINGNIRVGYQTGNTSSFGINLGTSGVGTNRSAYIFGDGTDMYINNQQNGVLSLQTNNSDKVVIFPNGNVNITGNNPNNYTALNIINTSNISSSVQINMQNGGGSYSLYATDNEGSPAESGLIPSTFQIYSYYPTPLPVLTIYPSGSTIIGNNTTNSSLLLNGPLGLGRVYDTIYNPPLSNILIISLQSPTGGYITYDNTVIISPGRYQIQLAAEAIVYTNITDTISIVAAVGDPPSVSNLLFSNASISAASLGTSGSAILGLNSGIFEYTGGTFRVTISGIGGAGSPSGWQAFNWSLQLVRY